MSKLRHTPGNPPAEGSAQAKPGACPDAMTLAAYLDGGMDRPERDALEAHMAACRKCAKDVEELRELLATLSDSPEHGHLARDVAERAKKLVGD